MKGFFCVCVKKLILVLLVDVIQGIDFGPRKLGMITDILVNNISN